MTPWEYWHSQFGQEITPPPPPPSKRELWTQAKRAELIYQYRKVMAGQGFLSITALREKLNRSPSSIRRNLIFVLAPLNLVKREEKIVAGILRPVWYWCEGEEGKNCIDTSGDDG